jgi:hypothetical protein
LGLTKDDTSPYFGEHEKRDLLFTRLYARLGVYLRGMYRTTRGGRDTHSFGNVPGTYFDTDTRSDGFANRDPNTNP